MRIHTRGFWIVNTFCHYWSSDRFQLQIMFSESQIQFLYFPLGAQVRWSKTWLNHLGPTSWGHPPEFLSLNKHYLEEVRQDSIVHGIWLLTKHPHPSIYHNQIVPEKTLPGDRLTHWLPIRLGTEQYFLREFSSVLRISLRIKKPDCPNKTRAASSTTRCCGCSSHPRLRWVTKYYLMLVLRIDRSLRVRWIPRLP